MTIVFCLQVYGRRGEWRGWDDFLSRETSPGLEEEDDDDDASTGAGGYNTTSPEEDQSFRLPRCAG
jgi:hypothetical protein